MHLPKTCAVKRLYVSFDVLQRNRTLRLEQLPADVDQECKPILFQEWVLCESVRIGRNKLLIQWWGGHGQNGCVWTSFKNEGCV